MTAAAWSIAALIAAMARRSVCLARGNRGFIPVVFFALAVVVGRYRAGYSGSSGAAIALCLAGVPATENRAIVFRQLLIWGWVTALLGGVLRQLLFGLR